jgi:hypothetical protein
MMCHYFHLTKSSKLLRTRSTQRNCWVHCFTSWVFFLIKTQNKCRLQQKYREYPPASWPHEFSCANKCQNKYSKAGREDKCSSIIYIAESCIPFNDCNPDFLSGSKISQTYIYLMKMRKDRNFSLF